MVIHMKRFVLIIFVLILFTGCFKKNSEKEITTIIENNKNILTGYTKQNMLVNFNDDKERPCQIGDLIQVKITKAYSWHLFGEVLK